MIAKLAEKLGLLDWVAPRRQKTHDAGTPATSSAVRCQSAQRASEHAPDVGRSRPGRVDQAGSGDVPEIPERTRRLEAQLKAEKDAFSRGHFAKKQRVIYSHRATNSLFEAVVCGVHLDDGPDKPYYSIRYTKPNVRVNENDGTESVVKQIVERQTDPERLERVPWDEDKAWEALQQ